MIQTQAYDYPATPDAGSTAQDLYAVGRKERSSWSYIYDSDASDILWAKSAIVDANTQGSLMERVDIFPDTEDHEAVAAWRDCLFTKDESKNQLWIYGALSAAGKKMRLLMMFEEVEVTRTELKPIQVGVKAKALARTQRNLRRTS